MLYSDLVAAATRVAATSKRSEKVGIFAELLKSTPPDRAATVVGLLLGVPRQGRIGVGWATLHGARVHPASHPTIDVASVDHVIDVVASTTGAGSQRDREHALIGLMQRLTEDEQDHFVRILTGEMRQGANDGVVTDAIAKAAGAPLAAVRRAAMLLGDLGQAAERALGGEPLDVGLVPLVAVQPMLAATSPTVTDAVAATGMASVEWKLDGIRVQAHKSGDRVRLFTRGLNDITPSLPTVVSAVRALPVEQIVLDGESLAFFDDGRPRKFQDTMSGLGSTDVFFFDALYLDGRSLIDDPLVSRKEALRRTVPAHLLLPTIDTDDGDTGERFAAEAVAAGHEGVVVKALESLYQAGRRGSTWRKVKPVHTLDLVVLAAEWGHGRRAGWLSNLHLGARGADGEFVMVGKTFKGMTDELLRWQTTQLQARAIGTEGITVHVRPELVVEIALDGVQASRRYPGGVALRFARVRRYRDDKGAQQADTIERVQSML
ncbi:MAG: ligase [Ilumatobacteraceae bacterium]|nr:ligase [Ilumatobacteraceae bacterium]